MQNPSNSVIRVNSTSSNNLLVSRVVRILLRFSYLTALCWLPMGYLHADVLVDPNVVSIIEEYEQKAQDSPKDPKAQGQLGMVYELHGYLQRAIEQYELAASLDVQEPRWYYYHALILASHFDRRRALDVLVKAMAIEPTYIPGWLYRGTWFLQLDEPAQALLAFERAKELGSQLAAEAGIARANLALGKPEAVIEQLSAYDIDRLHPNLLNLFGKAYQSAGELDKGRGMLVRVKSIASITWEDPWINESGVFKGDTLARRLDYAQLLFGMRRNDDALLVLEDLLKIYPDHRSVLFNLSVAYQVNLKPDKALLTLERGLQTHPDYYPFHTGIANLYKSAGKLSKAMTHLNLAIEIDPKASQAYEQKGFLLLEQKEWDEARLNLAIARRLEPTNPMTLVYLGMSLGMLDDWQQASDLFNEAILIDNNFIPAYVNLTRALAMMGQYTEARGIVQGLQELGAPDENVQTLLNQIESIENMRR